MSQGNERYGSEVKGKRGCRILYTRKQRNAEAAEENEDEAVNDSEAEFRDAEILSI